MKKPKPPKGYAPPRKLRAVTPPQEKELICGWCLYETKDAKKATFKGAWCKNCFPKEYEQFNKEHGITD